MKVLIVNKFLFPNGGSETYIFKLADELIRQGHEVQFFGMEHEGRVVGNSINKYTRNMDFHNNGILEKIEYPIKIIYSFEAEKKITDVLNDFRPDVVHLNNFNFQLTPSVIYACKKWEKKNNATIRIVYTAHDGQLMCPNHLMQKFSNGERCEECIIGSPINCTRNKCIHGSRAKSILGSVEALIYRKLKTYRLIDKVICPSNFIKSKLDRLPELSDRTIVIHNFIDKKSATKEKKENYILYFGRYSKEKGVDTLLKVCERLPEQPFVFAGNGPLEDELKKYSNIINMGFLGGEELVNVIKKAKFTVFPSECNENCPFTIMESISNGTPVIGSRVGGVPELISDGVNGMIYEAGDSEELLSTVRDLLRDSVKLNSLTEGAEKTSFLTLEEYTKEIVRLYQ